MSIFRILVQLVSTSFGMIYILVLSKWKYPRKTILIAAAVFIAVTTSVNFYIVKNYSLMMADFPAYDILYRAGNVAFILLTARFLTRMRAAQRFFTAATVGICVFAVDTVAITIRILFGIYPIELLFEFLIYPLMLLLIIKIHRPFLEITAYMKNRLWPLSAISLFLLICLFSQISVPRPLEHAPENIPVALMICGISAAVYGIVFFLFKILHTQSELEHNIRVMNLNTVSLEHQNQMALQTSKKMAMFRHDLRHTGQMMLACLDNGEIDEARKLIYDTGIVISTQKSMIREVTGHKLLDAVLGYFTDYARESDIDILISMERTDGMKADQTEFAVVLSNALENAVKACKKLPDGEPRVIRLDGHKRGGQFFLEIANTYAGEITFDSDSGLPLSKTKGHGLGSQSIAFFAQKHGAELEYSAKDNWFHFRILL